MIRKYKATIPFLAGLTLVMLASGCSHKSDSQSSLDQQKKDVMGSAAPPEVRAQVEAQQASQRSLQQAAQQQGSQQAAQKDAALKH